MPLGSATGFPSSSVRLRLSSKSPLKKSRFRSSLNNWSRIRAKSRNSFLVGLISIPNPRGRFKSPYSVRNSLGLPIRAHIRLISNFSCKKAS